MSVTTLVLCAVAAVAYVVSLATMRNADILEADQVAGDLMLSLLVVITEAGTWEERSILLMIKIALFAITTKYWILATFGATVVFIIRHAISLTIREHPH